MTDLADKRKRLACQWSSEQLGRACDGELSIQEWDRFRFHAAQCPQCNGEYELMQSQIRGLHALHRRELSEAFVFETMQQLGVRRAGVLAHPWMIRLATLMLVAGAGVATVSDQMRHSQAVEARQFGLRLPTVEVDYLDSASLQPVELDMVLHRARELNQSVRLSPVVPMVDKHRRAYIEEAAYQTVASDLGRYGDIADAVQLGEPVELARPSAAPFVVVVETGN